MNSTTAASASTVVASAIASASVAASATTVAPATAASVAVTSTDSYFQSFSSSLCSQLAGLAAEELSGPFRILPLLVLLELCEGSGERSEDLVVGGLVLLLPKSLYAWHS